MNAPIKSLITISSLTLGLSLSSCVDPYYATGGSGYDSRPDYGGQGYNRPAYGHQGQGGAGYTIRELPRGYRTEIIGGIRYFSHRGTYYRPQGGGYVIVATPRGATNQGGYGGGNSNVVQLPRGASSVIVRGIRYYEYRGGYYRPQGSGYVRVPSPY
jgi:hypothetical protein